MYYLIQLCYHLDGGKFNDMYAAKQKIMEFRIHPKKYLKDNNWDDQNNGILFSTLLTFLLHF